MRFIKTTTQSGEILYFNLDRIDAVNVRRNIVYTSGDVFFVTDEAMNALVRAIEEKE